MKSITLSSLLVLAGVCVAAQPSRADPFSNGHRPQRIATAGASYGGGFIELLMTGHDPSPAVIYNSPAGRYALARHAPASDPLAHESWRHFGQPLRRTIPEHFRRQTVAFTGPQAPGTVLIDTASKYLYLVQPGGRAIRYGIGVGREGFVWHGSQTISQKREWPDWRPPAEMLRRRPDLPRHMAGGPDNPLGARALYLGSTLYRIHGTNEPHTIGQNVSSGCIRMLNDDVVDLYGRVSVGTLVVVS